MGITRRRKLIIKNIWLYQIFFLSLSKQKTNNMEQYEVKCNWCDWIGYDDDLKVEVDLSDNLISHDVQYRKVCPECLSEDYLMDIEIVLQNKTN
jgi:hypothetical protein